MALVVYTTRRSSGGNSPNGTNSSQELRHERIMAGQGVFPVVGEALEACLGGLDGGRRAEMSRMALVMGPQCLRDAYRPLLGTMCTTHV